MPITPPNAVLSTFHEEEVNDVVVVLQDPTLDGDRISYQVEIIDGEMPASGGASAQAWDLLKINSKASQSCGKEDEY